MKTILFTFIGFLFITSTNAQDLIVTISNDSISCKIDEIYNDHIYFNLVHKKEIKSSLLPLNRVSYYEYGFYNPKSIPQNEVAEVKKLPKFRFAFNGGMSYRLSPADNSLGPQLQNHFEALKLGYLLGANASFFFNDIFGVGVRYSYTKASHEEHFPGGEVISDVVKINYVGPSFVSRFRNGADNAFVLGGGFGYMNYVNNNSMTGYYPINISGETLGLNLSACYDFNVSSILSVGIQLDLILGSLTTVQVEENGNVQTIELPNGAAEGLDRIDLTIALVLHQ
ncbi:hypothetical protein [Flammeovirga aprica]|uniref:Outer membrane protein beta-barrel domain-containing protein n=1 Tax=Flammeovirga aprica JL-4 TaxID=694437 RepID=A0A7X9RQX8_9BACT|nr:hypothetical protein [Flammeovirga aprica]NME67233.1 hypothetical protein [Flammeovirga aprica JL-4]